MLGLGPQLTDKATKGISTKWYAVLPLPVVNETIAEVIERDIMEEAARYINPPRPGGNLHPHTRRSISDRTGWMTAWPPYHEETWSLPGLTGGAKRYSYRMVHSFINKNNVYFVRLSL
jgi:hypothetical protein